MSLTVLNNKLKFLYVTQDGYPPFRVDVSILFGKEIASRGHQIHWLMPSIEPSKRNWEIEWEGGYAWVGANCNGTSRVGRLRRHFQDKLNDLKILGLSKKMNYDFIQIKDKFLSALLALLAAKINSTKVIFWLSYPFPEESLYAYKTGTARYPMFYLFRGYFLQHLLYKVILPRVDYIFVQSEQMKKDIVAEGIDKEKISAVPMGIDIKNIPFGQNQEKLPKNEKHHNVLYLGSMIRVRKIDFVIRMFSKVLQSVPDAVLYMVGGGDDEKDELILRNEVQKMGIENSVVFTGFLPMEKAWEYVRSAHVCVSPFFPTPILNSTSPTKLIEYMAMGKPVVANDHPEQRLVISESKAGICVPYEEGAFAKAVVELLENPKRALEMGMSGRSYVEKYRNYTVIADRVEQQYYQICQK